MPRQTRSELTRQSDIGVITRDARAILHQHHSAAAALPATARVTYRVAQNTISHRTKCNFSTTDRYFSTKYRDVEDRFINSRWNFTEIFYCFKNYSVYNILFCILIVFCLTDSFLWTTFWFSENSWPRYGYTSSFADRPSLHCAQAPLLLCVFRYHRTKSKPLLTWRLNSHCIVRRNFTRDNKLGLKYTCNIAI